MALTDVSLHGSFDKDAQRQSGVPRPLAIPCQQRLGNSERYLLADLCEGCSCLVRAATTNGRSVTEVWSWVVPAIRGGRCRIAAVLGSG
jgi:hypothetical protein